MEKGESYIFDPSKIRSEDWRVLGSLETSTILQVISIMTEETEKHENDGGFYPRLEYAISVALDKEQLAKEQTTKEQPIKEQTAKEQPIKEQTAKEQPIKNVVPKRNFARQLFPESELESEADYSADHYDPELRRKKIQESWIKKQQKDSEQNKIKELSEKMESSVNLNENEKTEDNQIKNHSVSSSKDISSPISLDVTIKKIKKINRSTLKKI